MRQHKLAAIGCLGVLLVCSAAHTTPQDQQGQPETSDEQTGYQTAHKESDAQSKVKLLDDFVAKYPDSSLLPQIYRDYYLTYFSMEEYPRVIQYADKLTGLGDKVDIDSRILALVTREVAYFASCSDPGLQTPEAYTKARDAGRQGLQMLGQWPKPENLTEEQFAAEKKSFQIILDHVAGMGESGLEGHTISCLPKPSAAPTSQPRDGRLFFDRMIKDIQEQERQSPRVR